MGLERLTLEALQDLLKKLRTPTKDYRRLDALVYCYSETLTTHQWDKINDNPDGFGVLHYTSSIDAVLTLFPKDLDGSNKAELLHSLLWQRRLGEIPDDKIALLLLDRLIEREFMTANMRAKHASKRRA